MKGSMNGDTTMKNDEMNDGEILEQLFRLYEQQMYRIASGILNNSHQAEDAVADAFERLIPYLGECNGLTDLRTKRLIVKIIKSTAVDIYRKNKRESMILSVDAGDFTEPGVDTIDAYIRQKDCEEMADRIIEELPEIYAGIVRLRFFYGLEIAEIAEILHLSMDNVYQRITRARKLIQSRLGDEWYEKNING